ncbi:Fungal specific transcription factor domain-containing protein [Tolypocladium paradoxum]|uniref:Fungal specific transcription factor domain-containing protein n=1 Tax=Tolypocladium paradoxum TaxID=94208 RepID=A0A2S4KQP5_9HYPO|nr:Fungal specific transcription factor domain-containing protein [Tolypocladium paradoxum]
MSRVDRACRRRHQRKANVRGWCVSDVMRKRLRPSKRGKRRAAHRSAIEPEIRVPWPADAPSDSTLAPPEGGPPAPGSASDGGDHNTIETSNGPRGRGLAVAALSPFDSAPSGQLAPLVDSSPDRQRHASYLGDSGYMQIFSNESGDFMEQQLPRPLRVDSIPPGVQEGHLGVFFEYAVTWCPVLDRDTFETDPSLRQSLLLRHALALCGNQIKPSLLHRSSSLEHYNRAKELFYGNHEPNPLIRIMALMLFYWWSAEPPNVVSLDNASWWTGTAIRLAQQIGLHRESPSNHAWLAGESPGLRRRLWWTLVARERITAVSQGRPCLIDLDDCDVPMPTPNDFPQPDDIRASIFVKWIPLCELIGRTGRMLRRRPDDAGLSAIQSARELIAWVQSLPLSLQPTLRGSRTMGFHRDVHGMHLTYLSTITLLHLSSDAQPLPKASIAAIVAASCTARIFNDYLVRGSVSFLAGQAGWYLTIAILALLHARRLEGLTIKADADIRILRAALRAMAETWHSARMFERGIEKLMNAGPQDTDIPRRSMVAGPTLSPSMDELSAIAGINWLDYFPYITVETSPLIGTLFARDDQAMRFPELGWTFDFPTHLNQFLTGQEDIDLELFSF